MSTPLQRSVPTLLAALAGLAVAAGAIRFEERLRPGKREPQKAPPGTVRASDEPRALQFKRAAEPDRGRSADVPTKIPWRGWKDIVWRTVEQISADRLLLIAGGVVFYELLATVPAITALVSMYGIFTPAGTINAQLSFLADVMPAGAYQLVSDQVVRIAGNSDGKLTQLAQFGDSFCDFAQCDVSRIKGLSGAHGRFGRVVATLGIFRRRRVGLIVAHVSAPHDSQEGREGSPLLVSGAQRSCWAARHSADGGSTRRA